MSEGGRLASAGLFGSGGLQVFGLSGSPRRGGNTDDAVRLALDELKGQLKAATTLARVSDYYIEPCRGCRSCMQLGRCIITDDEQGTLEDEMRRADVIIIGAPIYWWGVPGPLKNVLDRTHGHYAGERFLAGKAAAIITVGADSGFQEAERSISSVLTCYGAQIVSTAWIYAREVGDLRARPDELAKLHDLVASLRTFLAATA